MVLCWVSSALDVIYLAGLVEEYMTGTFINENQALYLQEEKENDH